MSNGAGCRTTFTPKQKARVSGFLNSPYLNALLKPIIRLVNKKNLDNLGGTLFLELNTVETGFTIPVNTGNYNEGTNNERFPNYNNNGINYKHNNWNNTLYSFKLSKQLFVTDPSYLEEANFLPMDYAKIQVKLEDINMSNLGSFQFQDPWYVLGDGTQPGNYWIPCVSQYEPTGKEGVTEKGVFLNQNPTFDPLLPNYSVQAISPQDIPLSQTGKTHHFYFLNWSANTVDGINAAEFKYLNTLATPVVFKKDGAIAKANFKGTQLSDNPSAFSNNCHKL
jgi:hypothetical protein